MQQAGKKCGEAEMAGIEWHRGTPPEAMRKKRLLIIGYPTNRNWPAAKPEIFIGHFGEGEDDYVPARIAGMSHNEARPPLDVRYWAELELTLPKGVELTPLGDADFKG
jgi:hypothetical protein